MAVGANPSKPPISPDYNPEYVQDQDAGMEPVIRT